MTTYRTGRHWQVTIVREGVQPPDEHGKRPDAQLVAVVVNGDQALAERICQLLNGPPHPPRCTFIRDVHGCLCEPWPDCRAPEPAADERPVECKLARPAGPDGPTRACPCEPWQPCAQVEAWNRGDPAAIERARQYGERAAELPADSCTCIGRGRNEDPDCPVHHGRRPRGPKPPPVGPGCVCDGSGRTCPRHGAVL